MPRFFFNFFDGSTWTSDQDGLELDSTEQAYLEAHAGARDMWAELLEAKRNPLACSFEVVSQTGDRLFELKFSDLLDSCQPVQPTEPAITGMAKVLLDTHQRALAARHDLTASVADVRRELEIATGLLSQFDRFPKPVRSSLPVTQ